MGFFDKLRKKGNLGNEVYETGLSKTKESFGTRLKNLITGNDYDEVWFDSLLAVLIQSDISIKSANKIIKQMKKEINPRMSEQEVLDLLVSTMHDQYGEDAPKIKFNEGLTTIFIVGVNGSGKTTTCAKLAKQYNDAGKKVLLVGGDTYRAAGSDQLKMWAESLGVDFYGGKANEDPASVYVGASRKAVSEGYDLMICDSAGRLHNKTNLMQELDKMKRVLIREAGSIDHTYLVIDGNTGQNGLNQVKEFTKIADVDSLIVTKLDGSSKGGVLLSIKDELGTKVSYIGLGETASDLKEFEIQTYLYSLFGDIHDL